MRRPGLCILLGAALLAPATSTPALTPPAVDAKTYPFVVVYGYPVYLAAGEARPLRRATAIGPVSDWLPDSRSTCSPGLRRSVGPGRIPSGTEVQLFDGLDFDVGCNPRRAGSPP
jgi:hypothetical protein